MSHFITDDSISQLPQNDRLGPKDLFIVSKKVDDSYKSRNVDYGTMLSCICADFDLSDIVRKIRINRTDINTLSSDVYDLSIDILDLSTRFLSNDELTRKIPELSDIILSVANESIYFQRIDKVVDLGTGFGGLIFYAKDSAVNFCLAGSTPQANRVIFRIPDNLSVQNERLSGFSRHLILDVSAENECSVKFSNNCSYVSTSDITDKLSSNSHTMFILKEIAPDIMYVQRQNVISVYSGTNEDELIVGVYYNEHMNQNDEWEMGLMPYEALSGTYIYQNQQLSGIADDISGHVNAGQFFQYIVDVSRPGSRLTIGDYLKIFLSTDVVLSAVYGNKPTFILNFYGNNKYTTDDGNTHYTLIYQKFPIAYGDNVYEEQAHARQILIQDEHTYISSDHYLISGWARGGMNGPVCRWYVESDFDIPNEVSDFQDTSFYTITDKIDNELSTLVGPFGQDSEIGIDLKVEGDSKLSSFDDADLYGTYIQLENTNDAYEEEDENFQYFLRLQDVDDFINEGESEYSGQKELSDYENLYVLKLDTAIYVKQKEMELSYLDEGQDEIENEGQ